MENQSSGTNSPSRFRWGRLLLLVVMAFMFMVIGYVGGNILRNRLIKKLDALDEKAQASAQEVEDISHELEEEENQPEIISLLKPKADEVPKTKATKVRKPKKVSLVKKNTVAPVN